MTFLKYTLSALIILTACVFNYPAAAEQVERVTYDRQLITRKASTNDEIGIAFLKTANNFPDFNKVVEMSDAYKSLDPLAQKDFLYKSAAKLQTSYLSFLPRKSDLIIRAKANVLFQKLRNGESILKLNGFDDDPIYFPFYFAGYPIALIIKDMEMFKNITLTKEETNMVYRRLTLSGDITLLLQIVPVAADDTKAMKLDNIDQYPMLAEIAYIGMLNDKTEQIWAWRNSRFSKSSLSGGNSGSLIPNKKK